eukprot:6583775-Alexandrium_andersonii.AAC.1
MCIRDRARRVAFRRGARHKAPSRHTSRARRTLLAQQNSRRTPRATIHSITACRSFNFGAH